MTPDGRAELHRFELHDVLGDAFFDTVEDAMAAYGQLDPPTP